MELNLLPSPQISVQVSEVVEEPPKQVHPNSTVQEELQPSPFKVLPSSQASPPILLPSPQIGEQVSETEVVPPDQTHPVSLAQLLLHPSPEAVFPSSQ
jgi:hypothetical protein